MHFGNSSAIRYSQFFDFNSKHHVYCNRGTSGIEGSTSTAIGSCMITGKCTFLITGDISFFYEINALWTHYIPQNFKIILINNGGGEIFNFIPGPEKIVKKDEFLITKHNRTAENLAKEFQFQYYSSHQMEAVENQFSNFLFSSQKSIFEIHTSEIKNSEILKDFFHKI